MTASAHKMIIVGFAGVGLSGWSTLQTYTSDSRNLSTSDLEYSVGTLERLEKFSEDRSEALIVWLKGKPLPFVASSRIYLNHGLPNLTTTGAKIRIGHQHKSIKRPNGINQSFYYIETLDVNDIPSLNLEASNRAKDPNGQSLKIFSLIMFVYGIWLITAGMNNLKKAKSRKCITSKNNATS
jgi:hypothetical protein